MNLVIVEGHLGADPVLNTTNTNNVPVCNIRVATNRKWNNSQGQLVEDVQWHSVVCWNKLANVVSQFMRKGSHVLIEGRLQTRQFMGQTTYENGQTVVDAAGQPILVKRYTTEIVASSVRFLDKKPQTAAYPTTGVAAPANAVGPAPTFVGAPVDPAAVASTFVAPVDPTTGVVPPVNAALPAGV